MNLTQAKWRKSSWSTYNGNCVEMAELQDGLVAVRDSKDAGAGQILLFDFDAWRSFLESVKER